MADKAILWKKEDFPVWKKVGEYDSEEAAEEAMLADCDSSPEADYKFDVEGHVYVVKAHQLAKEICPRCGCETRHRDLFRTWDYLGIPFRNVCSKCHNEVLDIGYDGEAYGPEDEHFDIFDA